MRARPTLVETCNRCSVHVQGTVGASTVTCPDASIDTRDSDRSVGFGEASLEQDLALPGDGPIPVDAVLRAAWAWSNVDRLAVFVR